MELKSKNDLEKVKFSKNYIDLQNNIQDARKEREQLHKSLNKAKKLITTDNNKIDADIGNLLRYLNDNLCRVNFIYLYLSKIKIY